MLLILTLLACVSSTGGPDLCPTCGEDPPELEDAVETGDLSVRWGRTLVEMNAGTDCAAVPNVLDALHHAYRDPSFIKISWQLSGALAEAEPERRQLAAKWARQSGATACGDVYVDGLHLVHEPEDLYVAMMSDRTTWAHCSLDLVPGESRFAIELDCLERDQLLEDMTLEVLLIENLIVGPQANGAQRDPDSDWYRRGDPIQRFPHERVPRRSLSGPEAIPVSWDDGLVQSFEFEYPSDICQDRDACSALAVLRGTKTRTGVRQAHTMRLETLSGEPVY